MIPAALDEACRRHAPKAVYLIPTIHNPTTLTIAPARREQLAAAIRRHDLLLFEDDAYGSLDPKAGADRDADPERSYLAVSLSKCIAPGLRVSFLLAPDRAAAALLGNALRTVAQMPVPLMVALAMRWLADGSADAIIAADRRRGCGTTEAGGQGAVRADLCRAPEGTSCLAAPAAAWTRAEFAAHVQRQGLAVVTSDSFSVDGEPEHAIRIALGAARSRADLVGRPRCPERRAQVAGLGVTYRLRHDGDAMFDAFDATLLARLQFAFTVSFHFIFPSFSIGLASYLAVLEALWLWTGRAVYLDLFKYWLKIFALAFGMGVVSGIVMSYQFGTNWSVFSDKVGPVIGPLMAYEVLTAFFLEAGFLGVMLFGMNRVGQALHFTATLAVAVGTFISAFWILSANSWMQTPAGHAHERRRPVRARRLAGDHLQSVLSLPPGPHRVRRLSHHRAGGRRASAPGICCAERTDRGRAGHVLDGDGHDHRGGAAADPGRRPARAEHARAPAGQGHGHGRPLPELSRRRAADPVRLARQGGGQGALFASRSPRPRR